MSEMLVVFAVALIVLGPRRLPEVARTLGKVLGDLRRTADDLRYGIEREVRLDEIRRTASEMKEQVQDAVRPEPRLNQASFARPRATASTPESPTTTASPPSSVEVEDSTAYPSPAPPQALASPTPSSPAGPLDDPPPPGVQSR